MARILIVEDDELTARAIGLLLRQAGYEIETVESGHEAIGAIMHAAPDLILLDLGLPGPDGASVLSVVRSQLSLRMLPVVVWTGFADSMMVKQARDLGAAAVLIKGNVSPGAVVEAVQRALDGATVARSCPSEAP